jgi:hypothetical protein
MSRLAMAGIVELREHDQGERWFVTKFADRQAAVSGAERVKRHRERNKKREYNGPGNSHVTNRYTDIDIDIDKDIDIYAHTSKPSKNGKPQATMHNMETMPDAVYRIITALSEVAKTTYWAETENAYHDAAYTLHNLGATPEQVQGFGQWWKDCGHYIGKPALKSIMADWVNYADGVKPGAKADEVVTFVVFDD